MRDSDVNKALKRVVPDPYEGQVIFAEDVPGYYRYDGSLWESILLAGRWTGAPVVRVMPAFEHKYVSTACQHELHEQCRLTCKYCSAPCQCKECEHARQPAGPERCNPTLGIHSTPHKGCILR